MHQIRFRLDLCPRARWGAHSAPPDPLAGFYVSYFLGKKRKGKGEKMQEEGEGGKRKKEGGEKNGE